MEASHFCIHLRHDLHQCVIFDRNAPDARLIGIEYIISEESFRELPEEEKPLWHSHHYEVGSGILVAPGIPEIAEHSYFTDLVTTYGKTFHTWQYDRDDFPYGIPQLMMSFTEDGQIDETMVEARDRRLGVSASDRRRHRADIPSRRSRRARTRGRAAAPCRPASRRWTSGARSGSVQPGRGGQALVGLGWRLIAPPGPSRYRPGLRRTTRPSFSGVAEAVIERLRRVR